MPTKAQLQKMLEREQHSRRNMNAELKAQKALVKDLQDKMIGVEPHDYTAKNTLLMLQLEEYKRENELLREVMFPTPPDQNGEVEDGDSEPS